MGKNSKINRSKKKRLKRVKRKAFNRSVTNGQSTSEGPVFSEFSNPFAGLDEDQRKQVVEEIQRNSQSQFEDSLAKLNELIKDCEPLTLLAILSAYGLIASVSSEGVNAIVSEDSLNQSNIEYFQALVLMQSEANWGNSPPTPETVQVAWTELQTVANALALGRMKVSRFDSTPEQRAIESLSEHIRGFTQTVRNWGYFSQVVRMSTELYSQFDDNAMPAVGFKISQIIDYFKALIRISEERLANRISILRQVKKAKNKVEMVTIYHQLLGLEHEFAEKFINSSEFSKLGKSDIFYFLMAHFDLSAMQIYEISTEEVSKFTSIPIENIQNIQDAFSLAPGAIANHPVDHLALGNPIWSKPIIKSLGKYFCPMPQLFFSFVFQILDNLIERFDKESLHQSRSEFLEKAISEIVKTRFPEASTIMNLKWNDDGADYENDLVTIIDSHLIIFEAKSHRISSSALRGAPKRLKNHIQEIIIDPSIQSKRLENKINELRLNPRVAHTLREKIPVDLATIKIVLRVSVSLEDLPTIQPNINVLTETGWLPSNYEPCPSMNLADFETIFDLLEHPVQILHYFKRRTELLKQFDFLGDELDVLGLYLDTLFENREIHRQNLSIIISGMSSKIDDYYNSMDQGVELPKPSPKISPFFKSIFSQLEKRNTPRWSEIGVFLNMFSPMDQRRIGRLVRDLRSLVDATWKKPDHKNMIIYSPPESSSVAMAYVMYKDSNAQKRDEFINRAAQLAMAPNHVQISLVIAKNIDHSGRAYDFIGLFEEARDSLLI